MNLERNIRKRRAILYDDDPAILAGLSFFFAELGYEVVAFGEPVECAIYIDLDRCAVERPCADIMITDLEMPRMSGLELLQRQSRHGCQLNPRNKAVLSGSLDHATKEALKIMGCAFFQKPCRLSALTTWVRECEGRMDLTQPLGVRRKERREACCATAIFDVENAPDLLVAKAVNRSDSGLCIRVDRPLAVAQVLKLKTNLPLATDRLEVRWTRPDVAGRCCAGMSCC